MKESLLEETMLDLMRIYQGSPVGDQVRGRGGVQGSMECVCVRVCICARMCICICAYAWVSLPRLGHKPGPLWTHLSSRFGCILNYAGSRESPPLLPMALEALAIWMEQLSSAPGFCTVPPLELECFTWRYIETDNHEWMARIAVAPS